MDYERIAEELLEIRANLLRLPANRMMNEFVHGEMFVLSYLLACGENVYPKDLSRKMGVSTARIAALLNQMERKGWIKRIDDPKDSRQKQILLTDSGKQIISAKKKELIAEVVKMLEKIGCEDAEELLRIQKKIMG